MWRARHAVSFPPGSSAMLTPPTLMEPDVGRSSPPMRFRSVDFPEPAGPISAKNSPLPTLTSSPCSTSIFSPPRKKVLWTPRTWTSVSIVVTSTSFALRALGDLDARGEIGGPFQQHTLARGKTRHDLGGIVAARAELD